MGNSHTTFMKMLIKLIAIGLVLAVCSADFDDTPVSEEMISEEAPELTLSQSPREWTPAPKTRPEKESAFDDVLSTTPDLDDPEDILTQNKARAGWWGHRHHPHRHDPHEKKKKEEKKKESRSKFDEKKKKQEEAKKKESQSKLDEKKKEKATKKVKQAEQKVEQDKKDKDKATEEKGVKKVKAAKKALAEQNAKKIRQTEIVAKKKGGC